MTEKKILQTKQGETLAGNKTEIRYFAEPETITQKSDGSEIITRAKYQTSLTPDGIPVQAKYIQNTYGGTGFWQDSVDGQKYQGPIIINMGPDTEIELRPPYKPYDSTNSGSDYC